MANGVINDQSIAWMTRQLDGKPVEVEAMMSCVVGSYNGYLDCSYTWCIELLISRLGRMIISMSLSPMGDEVVSISRDLGGVYLRKYWGADEMRRIEKRN